MIEAFREGLKVFREEGLKAFVKKSFLYVTRKLLGLNGLKYVLIPLILREFKHRAKQIYSIEEAVDLSFSFNYLNASIAPSQIRWEIVRLLELVAEVRPKVVLEIGTARGRTLFLFTRVADSEATIISVDLPEGPFGGGYPRWKMPLYKSFAKDRQRIHLIRADSHSHITLEKVKSILAGRKIDFLFIDGDHTYEGVKRDFEMYSPLVRERGMIAFHDIVPGPPENVGGVPKFWYEIKHKFKHIEIVSDWGQGGYGIGVLYV